MIMSSAAGKWYSNFHRKSKESFLIIEVYYVLLPKKNIYYVLELKIMLLFFLYLTGMLELGA